MAALLFRDHPRPDLRARTSSLGLASNPSVVSSDLNFPNHARKRTLSGRQSTLESFAYFSSIEHTLGAGNLPPQPYLTSNAQLMHELSTTTIAMCQARQYSEPEPMSSLSSSSSLHRGYELVDEKRVVSMSTGVDDQDTGFGPSSTWKVEFRGVVKLVRWVSGRSSPKDSTQHSSPDDESSEATTESTKPLARLSRVGTMWKGRTKAWSSRSASSHELDDGRPFTPSPSPPITNAGRVVSSKLPKRSATINTPPIPAISHLSDFELQREDPDLRLKLDDSALPASELLSSHAPVRPALLASPYSDPGSSVSARIERTLSLNANFPYPAPDEPGGANLRSSLTVPLGSREPRPRKLIKSENARYECYVFIVESTFLIRPAEVDCLEYPQPHLLVPHTYVLYTF